MLFRKNPDGPGCGTCEYEVSVHGKLSLTALPEMTKANTNRQPGASSDSGHELPLLVGGLPLGLLETVQRSREVIEQTLLLQLPLPLKTQTQLINSHKLLTGFDVIGAWDEGASYLIGTDGEGGEGLDQLVGLLGQLVPLLLFLLTENQREASVKRFTRGNRNLTNPLLLTWKMLGFQELAEYRVKKNYSKG